MEIYFMPSRSSINKFKVLIALNDIKDDLIFGKDRSTQKKGHKNESHGPLCNTKCCLWQGAYILAKVQTTAAPANEPAAIKVPTIKKAVPKRKSPKVKISTGKHKIPAPAITTPAKNIGTSAMLASKAKTPLATCSTPKCESSSWAIKIFSKICSFERL